MVLDKEAKYAKTHEWAKEVSGNVRGGISDYAQSQIGEVVFVELPEVGRRVEQGEAIVVIESVKSANDIYSSVNGEIVAVNEELSDTPELINQSPFEEGWIYEIKPDSDSGYDSLMTPEEYEKSIE